MSVLAPAIMYAFQLMGRRKTINQRHTPPIPFKGMSWKSYTPYILTHGCPELGHVLHPAAREAVKVFCWGATKISIYLTHRTRLPSPSSKFRISECFRVLSHQFRWDSLCLVIYKQKQKLPSPPLITHIPNMHPWRRNKMTKNVHLERGKWKTHSSH